jgi:rare lipoprotein A
MKQYIFTGLATSLLLTTVGLVSSSLAGQDQQAKVSTSQGAIASPTPSQARNLEASNVVKVGEQQVSETTPTDTAAITRLHPHQVKGKDAVTLYLRNIPVVTFLGSLQAAQADGVKVAASDNAPGALAGVARSSAATAANPQDPLWRATVVAARLNQIYQNNVDAKSIKVSWDKQRHSYVIRNGQEYLLELTKDTLAPKEAKDEAKAALEITNLLRQQLGEATPQTSIPGRPLPKAVQALASFMPFQSGMASWYGPGFQGNPTANGERFNQYALTAAHRGLPFGTRVRVTNTYNGRSVVVRINDRGPFAHGRVIDLSRSAAEAIGVVNSGVAPVRLEIMR